MFATKTRHLDRQVDGFRIHYREAGIPASTAVVLLHGSPSSSFSFRDLLPVLGEHSYVVAPDLPGFGFSDAPDIGDFTFERLSLIVDAFLEDLGVQRYVLYLTDFSTPVGYYMATRHPERVLGLVVQNGNSHEAGLAETWDEVRRFWEDPTEENRAALPEWLNFEGTRATYLAGLPESLQELHAREPWHLDWQHLSQPGYVDLHLRLFHDYRNHVARFDEISAYHRTHQPPCLVLWGRHDVFFDIGEVLAYHREMATFQAHIFDAGHFLLETHAQEVGEIMATFVQDAFQRTRSAV